MTDNKMALSKSPSWAKLYHFWKYQTPSHKGKDRFLNYIFKKGISKDQIILWSMKNGSQIPISPSELTTIGSVGWGCFENREWEPHVEQFLREIIKPSWTVLDIGANIGYDTVVMSNLVGKSGTVIAFEPVPSTYQMLEISCQANGCQNVRSFNMGLGSRNGTISMNIDLESVGNSSAFVKEEGRKYDQIDVKVNRLDDFLMREGVVPQLIKIDVEGYEMEVFRGAVQMLENHQPIIVFEMNPKAASAAGWKLSEFIEMLQSHGYSNFYHIDRNHGVTPVGSNTFVVDDSHFEDMIASTQDIL